MIRPVGEPRPGRALAAQAFVLLSAVLVAGALVPAAQPERLPAHEQPIRRHELPETQKVRHVEVEIERAPAPKNAPTAPAAPTAPLPKPRPAQEPRSRDQEPRTEKPAAPPRQEQEPGPKPRPVAPQADTPDRLRPSVPPAVPPKARELRAPTIEVERKHIEGVPLRVFVPSDPSGLERHLRATRGCLTVSRLRGGLAEVMATFVVSGGRAQPTPTGPCNGVPRVLRDPAINAALGDPLGWTDSQMRAQGMELGPLVLQVILSPALSAAARTALRTAFGDVPEPETAKRAVAAAYQIHCYAHADGSIPCR